MSDNIKKGLSVKESLVFVYASDEISACNRHVAPPNLNIQLFIANLATVLIEFNHYKR